MYITTGAARRYAVEAADIRPGEVRYTLAKVPAELGETVRLYDGDGNAMREDAVADFLRAVLEGDTLTLSNAPEPDPLPDPQPEAAPPLSADELAEAVCALLYEVDKLKLEVKE